MLWETSFNCFLCFHKFLRNKWKPIYPQKYFSLSLYVCLWCTNKHVPDMLDMVFYRPSTEESRGFLYKFTVEGKQEKETGMYCLPKVASNLVNIVQHAVFP